MLRCRGSRCKRTESGLHCSLPSWSWVVVVVEVVVVGRGRGRGRGRGSVPGSSKVGQCPCREGDRWSWFVIASQAWWVQKEEAGSCVAITVLVAGSWVRERSSLVLVLREEVVVGKNSEGRRTLKCPLILNTC
jgi:hypothetical protein